MFQHIANQNGVDEEQHIAAHIAEDEAPEGIFTEDADVEWVWFQPVKGGPRCLIPREGLPAGHAVRPAQAFIPKLFPISAFKVASAKAPAAKVPARKVAAAKVPVPAAKVPVPAPKVAAAKAPVPAPKTPAPVPAPKAPVPAPVPAYKPTVVLATKPTTAIIAESKPVTKPATKH